MVDRLEIIPGDVRGGGNITIPKNFSEDKNTNVYSTFLSENQAEIDGRWMPTFHSYYSNWYQLTVESDAPRIVSPGGDASFNVTVTNPARENVNGVHVDVSLRSKDGENEYWASSFVIMDNQPTFTLWVPEDCDKYCEWYIHATQGWYAGVGLHRSVIVADLTDVSFDVFGDKPVIQVGDTCNVIGLLTGNLGESVIGIPGQTVNFYETFTPGFKLNVAPKIIQVGDTSIIDAHLVDISDGSLIIEEGLPVNLYEDIDARVVYNNDGTDISDLVINVYSEVSVEDGCLKIISDHEEYDGYVRYPFEVTPDSNYLYDCYVGKIGVGQSVAMFLKYPNDDLGCWFAYDDATGKWNGGMTGTTFSNVDTGTLKAGDRISIKQVDGVLTLYHNDKVIFSKVADFRSGDYVIGHITNPGTVQYVKDITLFSFDELLTLELSTPTTVVDSNQGQPYKLTAVLSGIDVEGKTIEFINAGTMSVLGTGVTNSAGKAGCMVSSSGAGDVEVIAEYGDVTSNSVTIEDCLQVIGEVEPTGFSSIWASTPIIISGKMVKNGAWGGTRIYGGNGVTTSKEYVFLSQNPSNTSEDELIRYNVGTSWVSFECVIRDNILWLYVDGEYVTHVSTDTSGQVYISGGSTANPVSMKDIKIKKG